MNKEKNIQNDLHNQDVYFQTGVEDVKIFDSLSHIRGNKIRTTNPKNFENP